MIKDILPMLNPLYFWFANVAIISLGSTVFLLWPNAQNPSYVPPVQVSPTTRMTAATLVVRTAPEPGQMGTNRSTQTSKKVDFGNASKSDKSYPAQHVKSIGEITFFILDTVSLRDNESAWLDIFKDLAKDDELIKFFGTPPMRWVDAQGVRTWDGTDKLPERRKLFKNNQWNEILKSLGTASIAPDCANRVIWLIEDSSHPDKLGETDQLQGKTQLLPETLFTNKKLTVIWNGHNEDSKALDELFTDERLLITKCIEPYNRLRNTLRNLPDMPNIK